MDADARGRIGCAVAGEFFWLAHALRERQRDAYDTFPQIEMQRCAYLRGSVICASAVPRANVTCTDSPALRRSLSDTISPSDLLTIAYPRSRTDCGLKALS